MDSLPTRVPLVLAAEPWIQALAQEGAQQGAQQSQRCARILVPEPRRLAARAAAERMAGTLGEKVGATVGLRVRFGSKISARTHIEIVTEGVFTRLIIDDPMLEGVAAVLERDRSENIRVEEVGALQMSEAIAHAGRRHIHCITNPERNG